LANINSVIQLAHVELAQLEKEMMDDLLVNDRTNATHFLLLHKLSGLPNGEADEEAIQRKKARIAVTQVLVHSKLNVWIKEKALRLWIDQFLPKFSPYISRQTSSCA